MSVQVDSASVEKIARQMGEAGKPAPSWVRENPAYLAAYDQGTGRSQPAAFHPPAPRVAAQRPRRSSKPARTRPAAPARPGYFRRAVSPTGAAQRIGDATGASKVASAGDGGGLLLAFVIYPMALATIRYGAGGPAAWFRAKWLNQPTAAAATAGGAHAPVIAPPRPIRPGVPS
jgi:hypothetical protein